MGEGAFRCQTAVVEPGQFLILETPRGEATGSELLAERFRSQCQFLPRQFPHLKLTLCQASAEESDSPPVPGTAGMGVRRDDKIDVPLDERALGGNVAQQVSQAGRQRKPG